MAKIRQTDPEERAREQILRWLEVRARSRRELADRLRSKGHDPDVFEPLLDRLTEAGLIDDAQFARDRARALLRSKGWGPRKLQADLARHGVLPGDVEAALEAAYEEVAPDQILRREALKRFGEAILDPDGDPKRKQKAFRFLLGRGFEPDAIRELLGGG